jgi:predicted metal-binding membrane protein
MMPDRVSRREFCGVSALLFAAGAAATVVQGASMSAMGGMPMPGGWTMSTAWVRMCGQTWPGVATSFLGMWGAMTVAMMLPSLAPMLWRYRQDVGRAGDARAGRLTALVGVGYFCAWMALGLTVFPAGVALAALEVRLPAMASAIPVAIGVVVLMAGAFQFTAWKAHHLGRCRAMLRRGRALPADAGSAWRYGLRAGLHCNCSCAGLTAALVAIGVMDLRAMVAVAAAITAERLAPDGERIARRIGAVVVGVGVCLIARAVGFG